jgi:hypothetical protein
MTSIVLQFCQLAGMVGGIERLNFAKSSISPSILPTGKNVKGVGIYIYLFNPANLR